MKNRSFTLIEVLGTIIVLSIIVTSVTFWGDSRDFKTHQSMRDFRKEQIVLEDEVKTFMYENKNENPYLNGIAPTIFRASEVDPEKMNSEFLNADYTYWMDSRKNIWKSKANIPELVQEDGKVVRWKEGSFIDHYELYEVKIDKLNETDFRLMKPTVKLSKTQTSHPLADGTIVFVSAVDAEGFKTPPVASNDGSEPVEVGVYAEAKPVAKISINPEVSTPIEEGTVITISNDSPTKENLVEEEWLNKKEAYDVGLQRVGLRVKSQSGIWSDWVYKTFEVGV